MGSLHQPEMVALDAGGTMTDSFLVDKDGVFVIGKALTNRNDESQSYLESIEDAGSFWGLGSNDVHSSISSSLYTGTGMLNTVLTRRGKKVGMLVTRGTEQMVRTERALTWLGQSIKEIFHQSMHHHNVMLIEPKHIKPITERISAGSYYSHAHYPPGYVIAPLAANEVRDSVEELLDENVQVIGICFLNSHASPVHERLAAEIAQQVMSERGIQVPVLVSSDICPVSRLEGRFQTLLVESYAAAGTRAQLQRVEQKARDEGYRHDLLTMLSYGGTTKVNHPRMCETIISGPIGGLLGGKVVSEMLGTKNVMCSDMGGTTWDVGIIMNGIMETRKEPEFVGRRLNLPMVSLESFGAGTGSYIHVDEKFKMVELGPESAGADVGVCFRSDAVTIGDVDVVLGYINPDNFLGGKIKLDKAKAEAALQERVAGPLGLGLHEACAGILDILHSSMSGSLSVNLSNRGFNFHDYTLLVYGGGGPLHMWGFSERVPFQNVVTFPWAAAFSAFGNATGDFTFRQHKAVGALLPGWADGNLKMYIGQGLNAAWEELEKKILAEFSGVGVAPADVILRHGIYARYLGQLESWEAPVPVGRITAPQDMDAATSAFDHVYNLILPKAAAFPQAGYHITEVYVEGLAPKIKPVIPAYPLSGKQPPQTARKGKRNVYHKTGWIEFDIWEMDCLEAGNSVKGPSIIEHPMSTFVIPPGKQIDLDGHKFMWYRNRS